VILTVGLAAWPHQATAEAVAAKAALERIQTLAGDWQGTIGSPDGPAVRVTYRVTAAGSALVETLFPDTPHEMVTVYHMDGSALVLTHYCAAGNQPRMRFDPAASTAARLVFAFDGGTNLNAAVDTHMHSGVVTIVDAGRIETEWTRFEKGQPAGSHRFLLTRQASAPAPAATPVPSPTPAAKPYTIENCINVFDRTKSEPTQVGYQYWFVDRNFLDGRTLKMSVVAPRKATHAPHAHVEDEIFFVLEGTAEFYLAGQTKVAGPLSSFYCPSTVAHGIRNAGDAELKYLVIKKYLTPSPAVK
jgi:quercetin dioxygenase-like cupin family protein